MIDGAYTIYGLLLDKCTYESEQASGEADG